MLNLEGLVQTAVRETDHQYEIEAECAHGDAIPVCECGSPEVVKNGTKKVLFMDTPMHGKRVGIWVSRQRWKCKACGATEYSEVDHIHEKHRMTDRLYRYICTHGATRSWKALAAEIGIDAQTVSDIWNAYADAELAKIHPVTPEWLGIDELFIMGKYRAVITNIRERTLVTMLPDRESGRLHTYFMGVLDPAKVQVVTMDMWDPYRTAVRNCFPQAKIVVDRFHVMMYASKAVEAARKAMRQDLSKQRRVGLLGDRWLFLSARENLSAFQTATLEAVLEQYPTIKEAYHLKEAFRDVWKADNRLEAEARLSVWECQVAASKCADVFKPLLTALKNWREEIFGYMDWKLTNAYTESFNALARRMDNVGRGYSFEALKKRLLMIHGAHKVSTPPRFVRTPPRPGLMGLMVAEPVSTPEPGWLGLDISTLEQSLPKSA